MPKAWTRTAESNHTNIVDKGYLPIATLPQGYSLLRTVWSIEIWSTWGSVAAYPIGSAIMRAGIIMAPTATTPPPYPITSSASDWIDLVTLHPEGQIAISTNVDWSYNWNNGKHDRDSHIHRLNSGAPSQSIWLCWELQPAADSIGGLDVGGWSACGDCYISH